MGANRSWGYAQTRAGVLPEGWQAGRRAGKDLSPRSNKNPVGSRQRGCLIKAWQCPTFTWRNPTLSSALSGFTSEFGMGSGGSHSLWPPGKSFTLRHFRATAYVRAVSVCKKRGVLLWLEPHTRRFGCYMVKPHGQLVLLSSTPYSAYTWSLSTWWSTTALQGSRTPGEISSRGGFPA
jgi:hypothetical protein